MGRTVNVGRIARAHGVTGEVAVDRFGESPGILDPGRVLLAGRGPKTLTLTVVSHRPGPRGRYLVRFEGIEDKEAADALHGLVLKVDEADIPPLPDGRHYWFQLLGLHVVTPEGEELGTVSDVFETGANDIYVVQGPRGEILIPSTDEIVREIDVENGRMVVTPIPGLLPEEA